VDVGSNTVHVLVADAGPGGLVDVAHYVEMPELGPRVAAAGSIGPEKRAEAVAALERVLERARAHGYEHLVAGATSAVRRAADREAFLAEASRVAGVPVVLIPEELEAALSFAGVASRHAPPGHWVMADLGGGSTELVAAAGRGMERWVSLPLGSGALAAEHLSDPPTPAEREEARRAALGLLASAPDWDAEKLVATGGTATNLPLLLGARDLSAPLDSAALLEAADRLDAAPAAAVAAGAGLSEPRVRALRGGVEVLLLLLDFYGLQALHVSVEGLRHGMLLAYLRRGEAWWAEPVTC
jgi:exopolyphosphatase/guanosine-5'-triphosphate,3'-diphosphate pyrophosphatase